MTFLIQNSILIEGRSERKCSKEMLLPQRSHHPVSSLPIMGLSRESSCKMEQMLISLAGKTDSYFYGHDISPSF